MTGDHIGRYIAGRRGLEKIFKRNRTLQDVISPKERKYVLSTLREFREGGGVDVDKELRKASIHWYRNKNDPISASEARLIKRELREYSKKLQGRGQSTSVSRSYARPGHRMNFNDPRSNPAMNPPYQGSATRSMHDIKPAGLYFERPTTSFSDPRGGGK